MQYTRVGRDTQLGIERGASTLGAAVLVKYGMSRAWSLGARAEWLRSTGGCATDRACVPTNLLYGADSGAWSLTVTPTWQLGRFFARAEVAYVRTRNAAKGAAFGNDGTRRDQGRAMIDTGFLF